MGARIGRAHGRSGRGEGPGSRNRPLHRCGAARRRFPGSPCIFYGQFLQGWRPHGRAWRAGGFAPGRGATSPAILLRDHTTNKGTDTPNRRTDTNLGGRAGAQRNGAKKGGRNPARLSGWARQAGFASISANFLSRRPFTEYIQSISQKTAFYELFFRPL